MLRNLYYYCGWEYIGRKEQSLINRQKHLKYLTCEQVKKSKIKLKPIKNSDLFVTKILKKTNRKNSKMYKYY